MTQGPPNSKDLIVKEEGSVLLLVILILTLISVLILSWAQEWRTELKLASNFGEAHKCQRLAEAGIYYALGKMMTAQAGESTGLQAIGPQTQEASGDLWLGDQRPHGLELPDGMVEVRIADEGGKINLNKAPEGLLHNFFIGVGTSGTQSPHHGGFASGLAHDGVSYPRLYGAKSAYYLSLDPPYVAKNGKFETVEELAWVRGFEASPLIPRLSRCLTVQNTQARDQPQYGPPGSVAGPGIYSGCRPEYHGCPAGDAFAKFTRDSPGKCESVVGSGCANIFPILPFFYDYLHRYGKEK